MNYKIVSDSASNLFALPGVEYACVPLKIISPTREYVDTPDLDVDGMIEDLKKAKGPTRTSCPNAYEWSQAFEGADHVFAVTITSNLSGSCSAAMQAASERTNIYVVDTLSAGPEIQLVIEKLRDLIVEGHDFETIKAEIQTYQTRTHLLFSLESLTNLARNGRVSPAVAKIAGVLGLRLVGKASDAGTLEPVHKVRGEKKAISIIYDEMCKTGYNGGKVCISHCQNLNAAYSLNALIRADYPNANVTIVPCTALCSFYAESGGMLVGYEGF